MSKDRIIKDFTFLDKDGDRSIRFKFQGESHFTEARVLVIDWDGKNTHSISILLLDRCIHRPHEETFVLKFSEEHIHTFYVRGAVSSYLRRVTAYSI